MRTRRPTDGGDSYLYVEGLTFPPGSMLCQGRRGTVFVSSPDGKLTICPYAEHVRAQCVGWVTTPVFLVIGRAPRAGAAKSIDTLSEPNSFRV